MKYIILLTLFAFELFGALVKGPVVTVDEENRTIQAKLPIVTPGVSGFVVHKIAEGHSSILNNCVVLDYNKTAQLATLKLLPFNALANNALPTGKWKVQKGDEVTLAFAYSRALLIAPSEEIYHQVTKSVKVQWIHPDIFATILSYIGHPTPLKEDFEAMSIATSVGLVFFYLEKKIYTVDIKSFKILGINEAPLVQDTTKLPFYTRVEKIEANWFGEGSDELESYAPYYYELLVTYNPKNEKLYENIKNGDASLHFLLEKFDLGKE